MGKVADIYAEVGFKFDSVKLREVARYIGDLNVSSLIATTSLAGLGLGIKSLVDQSATLSNNLNILATTTGVDPQFIQKLEHAAFVLGSSKEAADQWIASLSSLQQKLMVAQGDQRFFTAAQMLGVDPVSFTKIIGTTEGLSDAVIKILSKTNNATDKVQFEKIQRTKAWLASLINVPPDLLTAFNNPDFAKQFNNFQGLSNSEIKQNIKSTEDWRNLVDQINMDFLRLANTILPQLTRAVDNFVNNGGLKSVAEVLKNTADTFYKATLVYEILRNYGKAALLNIGSAGSQPLISAANFSRLEEAQIRRDEALQRQGKSTETPFLDAGSRTVHVTVGPISIKTDNPQEFGKKFQEEFTKALDIATRQSPLGQT